MSNSKIGEENGEIWLSIMGEVYDVTTGREYYGGGPVGYGIFAGRDASVSFVSGDFTEEGAKKSTDTLTDSQLKSLDHWRKFYADHKTYFLVGVLEGRFYDKEGNPTEELKKLKERMSTIVAKKKARKGEERTGPPVKCNINKLETCSERAEKYANKWKKLPEDHMKKELARLETMTGPATAGHLKKWVQERILILQQIASLEEKDL